MCRISKIAINSLNSIFNSLNSNIHSMFDIEFSEFIAIFQCYDNLSTAVAGDGAMGYNDDDDGDG